MRRKDPHAAYEAQVILAGGNIRARRCAATSKRTKRQCGAPAMRGKAVCRFHGGKSTGPKTEVGRARIARAKTIHGRETRAIRAEHKAAMGRLRLLENVMLANPTLFPGQRKKLRNMAQRIVEGRKETERIRQVWKAEKDAASQDS